MSQSLLQQAGAAGEALSLGGGLFGMLGGGDACFAADSWGQTASLDSASTGRAAAGGTGCYSAFGFGGLATAALNAVHGAASGSSSLFGGSACEGLGTPTSREQPSAALNGIWGNSGDASSAGTCGSGFGLLGSFDSLQPSSMQGVFESHSPGPAGSLLPFPGGGGLQPFPSGVHPPQQQQLGGGGWQSSEGGAHGSLPHSQQPFSGLPLWGATGGAGAAAVGGAVELAR